MVVAPKLSTYTDLNIMNGIYIDTPSRIGIKDHQDVVNLQAKLLAEHETSWTSIVRRNQIKDKKERQEENQHVNEIPTLPPLSKAGARIANTREEVIGAVQCSVCQCSALQCSALQCSPGGTNEGPLPAVRAPWLCLLPSWPLLSSAALHSPPLKAQGGEGSSVVILPQGL